MHDLLEDLTTGKILLSLIDKILPKTVDWNKFSTKYSSRVHKIQNCNYVIELCQQKLGLKIVNISGMDIVDKNINLSLSILWQICNLYWERRVGKINKT